MGKIAFSIPVSGVIHIADNSITVTVNQAETTVKLESPVIQDERLTLPKGQTMFDVLLDCAQRVVGPNAQRCFTTADLYQDAITRYPNLKRNSWASHIIASAPNHPSHKHHASRRDFLDYIGDGTYKLRQEYLTSRSSGTKEG